MALRASEMVAITTGTTNLTLEAAANESFVVRDIRFYDTGDSACDVKVTVDRKSVLQLKAPGLWNLLNTNANDEEVSIWDVCRDAGLTPSIPVASGQKLTLSGGVANSFIEVVYDLYDADDVRPTDDNGSESNRHILFQVISNSAVPTVAGDLDIDTSDLDSEFINFPATVVPANHTIRLLGIFGSPVRKGSGSAVNQYSSRLRFLRDRTDIFDQDLNGMLYTGDNVINTSGASYIAEASRVQIGSAGVPPKIINFASPPVFSAGEELNVICSILETTGGNDLAAGDVKVGLVLDVAKAG